MAVYLPHKGSTFCHGVQYQHLLIQLQFGALLPPHSLTLKVAQPQAHHQETGRDVVLHARPKAPWNSLGGHASVALDR